MAQDEGRFVSGDQDAGGGGHVDEGTVHAWLDGQLAAEELARVEAHVASCEACSEMVAEARGFVAASSRILTALDGVPARVIPRQRGRLRVWQLRAAAAVVVMAFGAAAVLGRGGERAVLIRHEVASPSPEVATAIARAPADQAAPPDSSERRSTAASPPVAAPMPAAALPARPRVDELRQEERKEALRGTPSRDAKAALRKDLRVQSANDMTRADSAATESYNARGLGGIGGAGGRIVTRGVSPEANAPVSKSSIAAQAAAQSAPAPAGRVMAPSVVADSIGRAAKGSTSRAPTAGGAMGVAAPSAPADRERVRDSLFRHPPALTDSGYVPARMQRQITGRVVDSAARTPIAGATVRVARTSVGTTTNDTGAFVLPAAPHDTLDVRRIGYMPLRVALAPQQRDTTIALIRSPTSLAEPVVTGALGDKRAVQKQRRITGHVVDSATHTPVLGATVVIAGTAGGALTDSTGGFAIVAPTGTVTLVVRCVGYAPLFVTVSGDRRDTTIVLRAEHIMLPDSPAAGNSAPPR